MIIKLYDKERVNEITANLKEMGVRYQLKEERKTWRVNTVMYAVSQGHQLEMHIETQEGMERKVVREKLDNLEQRWEGTNYIRVHKSYLVNGDYARDVCRYEVLLSGGEKIPISKSRYKEVQEWWKGQKR